VPLRHFEPAGVGQSLSLLQAETPPPPPTGSHVGTPLASLQTKFEGQPDVEQSPAWHLLSAPQLSPVGQSDGLLQIVPPAGGGGTPSVKWQRWFEPHA
jgi:hypothetical protein